MLGRLPFAAPRGGDRPAPRQRDGTSAGSAGGEAGSAGLRADAAADAGRAFGNGGNRVTRSSDDRGPDDYNLNTQRFPLRSYGFGIRFNLFGFAILRWDYAKPLDASSRKGFGTWSFGPSF